METLTFTFEMAVVMGTLGFTIFLFVSEIIRIDLAAILVLVVIGILYFLLLGRWVLPGAGASGSTGTGQGTQEYLKRIYGLKADVFVEEFATTNAGIAEVVIPPDSKLIGNCPRELLFRKTYGMSLLAIHRGEDTFSHVETENHISTQIGLEEFRAGDMLVAQNILPSCSLSSPS